MRDRPRWESRRGAAQFPAGAHTLSRRVLFYVQHLLGVGHLKRAELLAQAMAGGGLRVTVALGGPPLSEVPFSGIELVELPAARIAGDDFTTLIDGSGSPVDDAWKERRRAALLALWRGLDPDVVLLELFPFGRRQFRFELVPLLEAIHASLDRARVACSVRDVLVAAKRPERDAEVVATIRRYFDRVLVHGDPALIPFERTFRAASEMSDRLAYTGYVAAPRVTGASVDGAGEVIVSAGGGAVGGPLLYAALAARPLTELAASRWRFLTGPNLPADGFDRLTRLAGDGALVERFRPDFAARLGNAALSISQAGYNTTMDLLRAGVPAVVVPYETAGETEQRLRAELLAERGLLTVVPAAELDGPRLARSIAEALHRRAADAPQIDLSGAARSAALVRELATSRQRAS